jgi:hypothetical protein
MTEPQSRYEALTALAARYRALARENYDRARALAEAIRSGFCAYLGSSAPPCVLLVPPFGPFEPIAYGDRAFSTPPAGFQPLAPILFGLAVRVGEESPGGEWLRVTLECVKEGETFKVDIHGGGELRFQLPLHEQDPTELFAALLAHVEGFFTRAIDDYALGQYGQTDMGFGFSPRPPQD